MKAECQKEHLSLPKTGVPYYPVAGGPRGIISQPQAGGCTPDHSSMTWRRLTPQGGVGGGERKLPSQITGKIHRLWGQGQEPNPAG